MLDNDTLQTILNTGIYIWSRGIFELNVSQLRGLHVYGRKLGKPLKSGGKLKEGEKIAENQNKEVGQKPEKDILKSQKGRI